jgi:hypothetical protein
MRAFIQTNAVNGLIHSGYFLASNNSARDAVIAASQAHGSFSGRNPRGGFWQKINHGQMVIGYDPRKNITSFHGFSGVVVHEEIGDTQGLAQ